MTYLLQYNNNNNNNPPTCGAEDPRGPVPVTLHGSGANRVLAAQHGAVRQRLGPQPLQQAAARLLHVLLRHLREGAVLGGGVVGRVHGGAGRREGGERGARRERGQGLRGVVRAFGLALAQGVRGEHGAVSGHGLRRRRVAEGGVVQLPGPVVALVLRDAVDVGETDGAEGASAGRQRAAAGGQRAAAAAGRHRQGAGRQAGDTGGGGSEET